MCVNCFLANDEFVMRETMEKIQCIDPDMYMLSYSTLSINLGFFYLWDARVFGF
jgi:hypothetical protein